MMKFSMDFSYEIIRQLSYENQTHSFYTVSVSFVKSFTRIISVFVSVIRRNEFLEEIGETLVVNLKSRDFGINFI